MTIEEALNNPLAVKELPRNIWQYLPHLKKFTNLETLSIFGYDFIFPDNFHLFEKLTHVQFREFHGQISVDFNIMLQKLAVLPNLSSIDLSRNRILKKIPDFTNFNNLTDLDLGYNVQILDIEKELNILLKQLPNLTYLNLRTLKLQKFPEAVLQLKQLKILDLTHNQFENIPLEIAELPHLEKLILGNRVCFPDTKELMKIVTYFPKYKIIERKMALSFSLDEDKNWGNEEHFPFLINLLNHPVKTVRIRALNQLEKLFLANDKNLEFDEQSKIVFAGKINGGAKEVKAKLTNLGLKVGSKITDKTTHILVGEQPAKKTEDLLNSEAIYFSEAQLNRILIDNNQLFLAEESNAPLAENLESLLKSVDPINQDLAINMMKSGGVSSNLIADLFVIYQYPADNKQKKEVEALLKRFASKELKEKLIRAFHFGNKAGTLLLKKVASVCENTELKENEICYLIFQKNGRLREYLLENGSAEIKLEVLKYIIKDGEKIALSVSLENCINQLKQLENLRHLSLYNQQGTLFPKEISQLKQLKSLQLNNRKLVQIQSDFPGFPALESLVLHRCSFNKMPLEITKIKSLKKLDLSYNKLSELPQEMINLTELEELNLVGNNFKRFPKRLLELPKLTKVQMYNSMAVMTPKQWLSM